MHLDVQHKFPGQIWNQVKKVRTFPKSRRYLNELASMMMQEVILRTYAPLGKHVSLEYHFNDLVDGSMFIDYLGGLEAIRSYEVRFLNLRDNFVGLRFTQGFKEEATSTLRPSAFAGTTFEAEETSISFTANTLEIECIGEPLMEYQVY